jgi:hypothetical protein
VFFVLFVKMWRWLSSLWLDDVSLPISVENRHQCENEILLQSKDPLPLNEYILTLLCSVLLSEAVYTHTPTPADFIQLLSGYSSRYSFFQPVSIQISCPTHPCLLSRFFAIVEFPKFIAVAFRGTTDTKDWLTNFEITPQNISLLCNASVHQGFFDAACEFPFSAFHESVHKRVVFCGHSKGGAVAELVARLYVATQQQLQTPLLCLTFGQPHISSTTGPLLLQDERLCVFRYLFEDDPVPFALNKVNFRVSGNLILLCESHSTPTSIAKASSSPPLLPSVDSHAISRYVTALIHPELVVQPNQTKSIHSKSFIPINRWWIQTQPTLSAAWVGEKVTLEIRGVCGDSVREIETSFTIIEATLNLIQQNGKSPIQKTTIRALPKILIEGDNILLTAVLSLPSQTVPDDGFVVVELWHAMYPDCIRLNTQMGLNVVWFLGEVGAGKTQLIRCLRVLAKEGRDSSNYRTFKEIRTSKLPSDEMEEFVGCGIAYHEILGIVNM